MPREIRRFARVIDTVRRGAVILAGFSLLIAGAILLVLPGPGLLVVALGLAILAREFWWARRLLDRARVVLSRR